MRLFIDQPKLAMLKSLKGWKDPNKTIAERTGWHPSYISQVLSGKRQVSLDFAEAYASLSGADPHNKEEYWGLFTQKNDGKLVFPKDNYAKYFGEKPHKPGSEMGAFRKSDSTNKS